MDTQNVIDQILAGSPMNAIISDLIEEHTVRAGQDEAAVRGEYKGDVPIKHRSTTTTRVRRSMSVSRATTGDYIVDTLTGYLFGNPIAYGLDKEQYGEATGVYDNVSTALKMFARRNSLADLDSETGKKGFDMRLWRKAHVLRHQRKGEDHEHQSMGGDIHREPIHRGSGICQCCIIRWSMTTAVAGCVEWYDRTNWQEFELDGGIFKPLDQPKKHMFDGVPLIEFPQQRGTAR